MKFLKKYWYLLTLAVITVGVGAMALLTSQRLTPTEPVAPTVPQSTPEAATPACTLTFSIASTPTPTGSITPTITPTGSLTPTQTVTPTVTGSITPTTTGSPTPSSHNTNPECTSLAVEPNSADEAPLTVTLTCTGRDVDGDITAAEFDFGDGQKRLVERNVGSPGTLTTTYTYNDLGLYKPTCRMRDNNNTFTSIPESCKKTVNIGDITPTPTTTEASQPTPKVPVAGAGLTIFGSVAVLGGILLLLAGLAF